MTIFTIPEAGTHECFGQVLRHIGKPCLLLFCRLVNQCTKRQKSYGVGKFYSIQPLVFYYLKKCQWFKAFTVAQWLKFITLYTDTLLTTHCDNPGAAICLACTGAGTVPEALQMPPARCQEGAGQPRAARATDSCTSALCLQAQTPAMQRGPWGKVSPLKVLWPPGVPWGAGSAQLGAAGSPKDEKHLAPSSLAGSISSGHWEPAGESELCLWVSKSSSNKTSQIDSD